MFQFLTDLIMHSETTKTLFLLLSFVTIVTPIVLLTMRYARCEICGKRPCECSLTAQVVDALTD